MLLVYYRAIGTPIVSCVPIALCLQKEKLKPWSYAAKVTHSLYYRVVWQVQR